MAAKTVQRPDGRWVIGQGMPPDPAVDRVGAMEWYREAVLEDQRLNRTGRRFDKKYHGFVKQVADVVGGRVHVLHGGELEIIID